MGSSIHWDAHSGVPLKPDYSIHVLQRHLAAGFNFVSINVGMDINPTDQILSVLASFRRQVERSQQFVLVRTVDDVTAAARMGKLAIAFDLEGAKPILSNLAMVQVYYDLGIRQMHFAYNRANEAAGGCYDPDAPLTPLGARLVAECQEVGIIVDCSHINERSAMAIMEIAANPVVFSHSNVRAYNPNLRNITDTMIHSCAQIGGVIGINGMSNFHRDCQASIEGIVEQIDYVAQRVGPRHVGIGLDYVYNQEQDDLPVDADPAYWFPREAGYDENFYKSSVFVPPESLSDLGERLSALGYSDGAIAGIWGGNFLRIARTCWKS
jgi:membrane dipeptidase